MLKAYIELDYLNGIMQNQRDLETRKEKKKSRLIPRFLAWVAGCNPFHLASSRVEHLPCFLARGGLEIACTDP